MSEKLSKLKELLGEVSDINKATSVLGWDQQVNMPPGGAEGRGQQLATLGKIAQEKFTTDEVGKLLDDLKQEFAGADASDDDAAMIRVAARRGLHTPVLAGTAALIKGKASVEDAVKLAAEMATARAKAQA